MSSSNYSKIVFIFCAIGISFIAVYILWFPSLRTNDPLTQQIIADAVPDRLPIAQNVKPVLEPEIEEPSVKESSSEQPTVDSPKELVITYADYLDNLQWHSDRGYNSLEDQAIYRDYERATLEGMAKNGDTLALNELATRLINEGAREQAKEALWTAVVLGDSAALLNLSSLSERYASVEETIEVRKAVDRQGKLESLAVARVAAIRGDIAMSKLAINSVKTRYQVSYNEALELTQDELDLIKDRAAEIYQNLQAKRTELGLGDFDNSTPEIAKELYKNL